MNGHFSDIFGVMEKPASPPRGAVFAVASGDFPGTGIALPFGNRRVRAAALEQLLLYKGRSFGNKVKVCLLHMLNFPFVWNLVFRKKFVLLSEPAKEDIASFLAQKIGSAEPVVFSVYAGSRKFILPLFGAESGNLLGVAKVYFPGEESAEYGENEARVLERLGGLVFRRFRFPKVLVKDRFRGSLVLVLSSSQGLASAVAVAEPHLDFLKQLSERTGTKTTLSRSGFSGEMQKEVDLIRSRIPGRSGSLERLLGKAMRALGEKEFLCSLAKREFPCFEMTRDKSGGFLVIDWEQARSGFPPLFDLYSLLMSSGRFKRGDYVKLYGKNVKDLFFGGNGRAAKSVKDMAGFWGIGREEAYRFFVLFLIDQLYIHLHAGHHLSAERVIALLEEMSGDEKKFSDTWLKF